MTAVTLYRSDLAKNPRRYYRLDIRPDLFGAWCLIREWGCIGRAGQIAWFPVPLPPRRRPRLSASVAERSAKGMRERSDPKAGSRKN